LPPDALPVVRIYPDARHDLSGRPFPST